MSDVSPMERSDRIVLDAVNSDPRSLHEQAGTSGRLLIAALDRAVAIQTSAVEKYVSKLREKKPSASPAEVQRMLDNHLMYLATGAGAGAGATATIPGLGFLASLAAVGAESVVFLDAAAFYTIASAHLRGIDIRDAERRRALILVTLIGSAGTALVDAAVGDLAKQAAGAQQASAGSMLGRFGAARLRELNGRLVSMATKRFGKSLRNAWLGKLMPLGIGAVLGTVANRKLAKRVIANSQESLGLLPQAF